MAENSRAGDYIRSKLREKGLSQIDCARAIGVKELNFRQALARGRFPRANAAQLAQSLGVTIEKLQQEGVQFSEPQVRRYQKQNLLPLLRNIAASGIQELTGEQLSFIFEMQRSFPQPMSSALIAEMIKNQFQDTE